MRKKYLSALLFGALLVTSAGTFTSCKDYDDEINGLQEQIDEIKTTLSELEKQIGTAGVSSVTFDEATGVLTVVDGNGTKTYKIQTTAEAKVDAVIKDGILTINGKEIGKVGGDEVKVEDGKLKVNGDVVYEFGPKVALVKNLDNGTCTLTVGDETVTLPLASSTGLVSLVLNNNKYTFGATLAGQGINDDRSAIGIYWGLAADDLKSQGAKGDITKGQFLVGQIAEAPEAVTILPASYDLSAQSLTLRDSKGNKAPVYVKAVAKNGDDLITDARAADVKGQYNLIVEFTNDVNKDNIKDVFMSEGKNILYALFVNGVQYSDYSIAVKVDPTEKKDQSIEFASSNLFDESDKAVSTAGYKFKVGDNKLHYDRIDLYDSYITFEGTEIDKAKLYGVEANGMTLTISDKAKGKTDLVATVHLISVSGKKTTGTVTLNIAGTSIETPSEIAETKHTLAPNAAKNEVLLNVAGIFDNLSTEDIESVKNDNQISVVAPDNFPFTYSVAYLDSDKKEIHLNTKRLVDVAYIKLTGTAFNIGTEAKAAKPGVHDVMVTINNGVTPNTSEIMKFKAPVNVSLPAFADLFGAFDANKWEGNKVTARMAGSTRTAANIDMNGIFKSINSQIADISGLKYQFATVKDKDNKEVYPTANNGFQQAGAVTLNHAALKDKDDMLMNNELSFKASYSFISGNADMTVSNDYILKIQTVFEGAELSFYKAGKPGSIAEYKADANYGYVIPAYVYNSTASKINGLGLSYLLDTKGVQGGDIKFASGVVIGDSKEAVNKVKVEVTGTNGISATLTSKTDPEFDGVQLTFKDNVPTSGTLTFKFTDFFGFVTKESVDVKPAN